MSTNASFLPELEIGVETPWPSKREGKQVYAKLIDFGGFPAPYGLRGKSHDVPDIEWSQISWDHSYVSSSTDSRRRSLALVSTPAVSGGTMPWRFLVDSTSVQVNMLTNVDYREWDTIVLCLLYTKTGEGAESGSLILPGPEGTTLTNRDGKLSWEEASGSLTREEILAMIDNAVQEAKEETQVIIEASRYNLCEFYYFRSPVLRPGFQPAQGGLIENAAEMYPEAWAYLQTAEGQALCKTEAEWQAMTRATWATLADGTKIGWNGIGGAPFFAPDFATGALRLPDIRGMYAEAAGFDSLNVGGTHLDTIREMRGITYIGCSWVGLGDGVFKYSMAGTRYMVNTYPASDANYSTGHLQFIASRAVPTGNKNAPRAWGALPCVYLGKPTA